VWVLGVSERGSGVWLSARERGSRERGASTWWLGPKPVLGGKGARGLAERLAAGKKTRPAGHGRGSSGLGQQAERGEGERQGNWALGPEVRGGGGFLFILFFFYFKAISIHFQKHFELYTKPHITTNHMHHHVCTSMLLTSYDEF